MSGQRSDAQVPHAVESVVKGIKQSIEHGDLIQARAYADRATEMLPLCGSRLAEISDAMTVVRGAIHQLIISHHSEREEKKADVIAVVDSCLEQCALDVLN